MLVNGARNYAGPNKERARKLRREATVSEQVLWRCLRKGKPAARFRRQYPVGPYVLDFYCPEARVCVEVDGEQHALRQEADQRRDKALAELGILTIRIPSVELFGMGVGPEPPWLEVISETCFARRRPPRQG